MKKNTNVEVELRKGDDNRILFYLKQYDDVVLDIKVFDGLTPVNLEGETVYVAIDKPDGTKVLQKDNITVTGEKIEVILSPQAVTSAGIGKLELILESKDGLLTTAVTNFMISESLSTSIVDIITSSDDIHHLRLIEDFILNSNLSIEDITYSLNAVKARIRELEQEIETAFSDAVVELEKEKENALDEINETKEEILSTANTIVRDVEIARGEVNELMATIDATKEEVDEMGRAQVENILGTGITAVNDVNEAKDVAVEGINAVKEDALGELNKSIEDIEIVKENALDEIDTVKEESMEEIRVKARTIAGETIENIGNESRNIKEETIEEIENKAEELISISTGKVDEIVRAINDTKDYTLNAITEEKTKAVDTIIEAGANTLSDITEEGSKVLESIEEGVKALDGIEEIGTKALEDIAKGKEDALVSIANNKTDALDTIANNKTDALDTIAEDKVNALRDIEDAKAGALESINNEETDILDTINEEKTRALIDIEENRVNALDNIEEDKINALDEIGTAKTGALGEIETSTVDAITAVTEGKENALGAITEEEAKIIERISQVEVNGVEGVDSAVKVAEKRLQELTVSSMWDVREAAAEEQEEIERVSNAQQAEIKGVAQAQKESIALAGENIVKMVEDLDASIEDGLDGIDRAITAGKSEIRELSNGEIEKIKAEGQEIIEYVNNLESIAGDHIEDINEAGRSAREGIERTSTAEQGEIRDAGSKQIELIGEAGTAKLEEINAILGVSKGEVEELLGTTRNEINTHRAETIGVIENLRDTSIEELTTKKAELLDELLGAEIALEQDFTELRDRYIAEITDRGNLKIDILSQLIETIEILEERVEKKLEESEDKTDALNDTLTQVTNKIAEIKPTIDKLNEFKTVCSTLEAENAKGAENIEQLLFIYEESDVRVAELRRLIELAKEYENMLIDYIENKNGNYQEIEARLTALEEAIGAIDLSSYATKEELSEAINNIEIPDIEGLATKTELQEAINNIEIPDMPDLSPYATKEELSEAINNIEMPSIEGLVNQEQLEAKAQEIISMIPEDMPDVSDFATKEDLEESIEELNKKLPQYNGIVGDSDYPSVFASCPEPEAETVGVIEAFCVYNKRYVKIYIHQLKEGTTMDNTVKILDYSTTYRLHISTAAFPSYTVYAKKETEEWTKVGETGTSFYCYLNTKNKQFIRRLIYRNDIPLECTYSSYAMVLDAYAEETGAIGSYNDAVKAGTYKASHKSRITGAPRDIVEGVLTIEKADDRLIQRLVDNKGKVYTRYKEDSWGQWVGEGNIGEITYAVKTIFDNIPEYGAPGWRLMPEKSSEYPYRLIVLLGTNYGRIIDSKQDLTGYIRYNKSTNKIVLGEGYENLDMKHYYLSNVVSPNYSYSDMGWSESTSATQYLSSVVKSWYAHNFDILDVDGNVVRKSDEFDTSNVTLDFNEAIDKDMYKVDIQVDDDIANKPHNERIRGFLEVKKCGVIIKQTLTTAETEYYRVYDEGWSNWRTIVTQDMFYNLMSLMNINAK